MNSASLKNLLLFSGSALTLVAGLLAAFVPILSYVTVQTNMFVDRIVYPNGLASVYYPPLALTAHLYTARLLISAIGGLFGLLAVASKNRQSYTVALGIALACFGLMVPATETRITSPELFLFDVPWAGSFLLVVGSSLMFIGWVVQRLKVPRISFLGAPFLMLAYSIRPILVLANFLPWTVFDEGSPVDLLILFLMIVCPLLMIWGVLKVSSPSEENNS